MSVVEHLTRLHLILKPFMLRRIKKDVENELSDKIEIMKYCPLTSRQKMLYAGNFSFVKYVRILSAYRKQLCGRVVWLKNHQVLLARQILICLILTALRKKIRIEDLLHSSGSYQSQSITSSLMNLVMQFRKVS